MAYDDNHTYERTIMDHTRYDVDALRMQRAFPNRNILPKEDKPAPGWTQHMSLAELRAAINSPITFKH